MQLPRLRTPRPLISLTMVTGALALTLSPVVGTHTERTDPAPGVVAVAPRAAIPMTGAPRRPAPPHPSPSPTSSASSASVTADAPRVGTGTAHAPSGSPALATNARRTAPTATPAASPSPSAPPSARVEGLPATPATPHTPATRRSPGASPSSPAPAGTAAGLPDRARVLAGHTSLARPAGPAAQDASAPAAIASATSAAPIHPEPAAAPAQAPGPTAGRRHSDSHKWPAQSCDAPAPRSAAEYTALWNTLPADQWGAADLSISIPAPDGRVVWLYGDTLSTSGFRHSTAIVQQRGCLHVANRGGQLVPDEDYWHIYWIESGRFVDRTTLEVRARRIEIFGTGPWDFRDDGVSRLVNFTLQPSGDLAYRGWSDPIVSPPPDPGPFYDLPGDDPHHYGYARYYHPWAQLDSGNVLTTTAQNWDDGVFHPIADYRPIFSETTPSEAISP